MLDGKKLKQLKADEAARMAQVEEKERDLENERKAHLAKLEAEREALEARMKETEVQLKADEAARMAQVEEKERI